MIQARTMPKVPCVSQGGALGDPASQSMRGAWPQPCKLVGPRDSILLIETQMVSYQHLLAFLASENQVGNYPARPPSSSPLLIFSISATHTTSPCFEKRPSVPRPMLDSQGHPRATLAAYEVSEEAVPPFPPPLPLHFPATLFFQPPAFHFVN